MTQLSVQYVDRFHQARRIARPASWARNHYMAKLLRTNFSDVARQFLAPIPDATLMDLGCGNMPWRALFGPHVDRYVGIDLPGNARAAIHLDAAGRADTPDAAADAVLSIQVLEHVDEPQRYLAEARRLLKPDGLLILTTHGYWKYHPDPLDLWRWTGDGLRRELDRAGFEIRELRGLMGLAASGLQLAQDGLWGKLPRALRPPLGWITQHSMMILDRMTSDQQRQRDAAVYLAVATPRPQETAT